MSKTNLAAPIPVTGDNGLRGTLQPATGGGPVPSAVTVVLADGRRAVVPAGLLQLQSDGSYYLPLGLAEVDAATAAAKADAAEGAAGRAAVIPLVAEQIDVQKRRVETGRVRITKSVEVDEQVIDVPLQKEEVVVERVPVERFVTEVPAVRHEGDTMIVPVMEEVLVVEKRLMLREELRLTTRRTETRDRQTIGRASDARRGREAHPPPSGQGYRRHRP